MPKTSGDETIVSPAPTMLPIKKMACFIACKGVPSVFFSPIALVANGPFGQCSTSLFPKEANAHHGEQGALNLMVLLDKCLEDW